MIYFIIAETVTLRDLKTGMPRDYVHYFSGITLPFNVWESKPEKARRFETRNAARRYSRDTLGRTKKDRIAIQRIEVDD